MLQQHCSDLVLVTTMHVSFVFFAYPVLWLSLEVPLVSKLNKTFQSQGFTLCLHIPHPWFLWEKPYTNRVPTGTDS